MFKDLTELDAAREQYLNTKEELQLVKDHQAQLKQEKKYADTYNKALTPSKED